MENRRDGLSHDIFFTDACTACIWLGDELEGSSLKCQSNNAMKIMVHGIIFETIPSSTIT